MKALREKLSKKFRQVKLVDIKEGKVKGKIADLSDLVLVMAEYHSQLPADHRLHSSEELSMIFQEVKSGKYQFHPMRRFVVPKPEKPGQQRVITKPGYVDFGRTS